MKIKRDFSFAKWSSSSITLLIENTRLLIENFKIIFNLQDSLRKVPINVIASRYRRSNTIFNWLLIFNQILCNENIVSLRYNEQFLSMLFISVEKLYLLLILFDNLSLISSYRIAVLNTRCKRTIFVLLRQHLSIYIDPRVFKEAATKFAPMTKRNYEKF